MPLAKPLDQISKADVDLLVQSRTIEQRTLDYKEALPERTDSSLKDFLADVCSFANGGGGDILFGVKAERDSAGKPTGAPEAALGLANLNVDAENLRLTSQIRDGIQPRIPGFTLHPIPGFPTRPVLLLRIPKSWAGPHMVTFKGSSRFYSRTSNGKYQLDVSEIRTAFNLSEKQEERVRSFRAERLARLIAGETPVPLPGTAKAILHLIPLARPESSRRLNVADAYGRRTELRPLLARNWGGRVNLDGLITFARPDSPDLPAWGYVQVFRDGSLEAVDTGLLNDAGFGRLVFGREFEDEVLRATGDYLAFQGKMTVPLPIVVLLSLTGVRGYQMDAARMSRAADATPIQEDVVLLPDVLAESYDTAVDELLRPVFDAMWQAAGWLRSPNYDGDGKRTAR